MKKTIASLFILICSISAQAQLQLPQPSPFATVSQTAGLTDISIEYSSPGVKGRTIWGGLLPYNQLWRTGANAATKISFSKDVTINGQPVPKGKYSIFTIPMQTEFTVILNKDENATTGSYKKEQDLMRFNVKMSPCEFRERLAFMISDFDDTKATVVMEWEKARVAFDVKLDTENQALDNISKELGKTWRTYNNAARYHLDLNKDLPTAMKYIDQSLSLKEDWLNSWTKAQLFNAMNQQADAYKWALKAKTLGDLAGDGFFYKSQVEKALVDWKQASGTKKGK